MSSSMGQTSSVSGSKGQGQGQSVTGVPDPVFDLVSVLYHTLESGMTNQKYLQDAQQAGNNDLMHFFQQVQQEDRQRAQRAQQLLSQTLSSSLVTH
jgi:hypothetical protein